ncbi:MAG: DUF4271 domain-containing protein [Alistipes sp.]|nr:DUF4271 domain-containing protein [Alistipes sp.]
MNNQDITYLKEQGYHVVSPARLFGRSAELQSGEAVTDGGYREVGIAEMFGLSTERGDGGVGVPYERTFSETPLFQSIVLATIVVYLAILLRSWGFIRSIWSDIFTTSNERRMVFEGGELPLQRFKSMASLLGFAVVALVVVRLAESNIEPSSEIYSTRMYSLAPLASMAVMFGYAVWRLLYHKVVGWVIASPNLEVLSYIGYTNFVHTVVLLYPVTAIWLLKDGGDSSTAGVALVVCASVLLAIYLKDVFMFFIEKKISIFYCFLYLCTAILLPWSLLFKLLAL